VSASDNRTSASVLLEAAKHETALVAQLTAAEQEAQRIIGLAHEQAAAHLTETAHRTERDIAEMRRQATAEREREEQTIVAEADRNVASIRAKAAPNRDGIRQAVVARILPAGAQGVVSS
jgi:vacuolar-type H+-ATPase subunit H